MKQMRLFLIVSICMLAGCKTSQQTENTTTTEVTTSPDNSVESVEAETITYEMIHQGVRSGIREESQYVIRDQEEWTSIWKGMNSFRMPAPEQPEINFDEFVILACFMGQKNSGGYQIDLSKIEKSGTDINVYLTYTSPGKTCIVTESLTEPVILLKVHRTKGVFSFNIESITKDC